MTPVQHSIVWDGIALCCEPDDGESVIRARRKPTGEAKGARIEGAANNSGPGRSVGSASGVPGPNPYTRGADGIMFPQLSAPDSDPTP